MNYLGIDYGKAKVGIAVATGPLADPIATPETKEAIETIKKLVKSHKIDLLVVGDSPETFLKELSEIGLPIQVADETLSSHDAREALLHKSQKKRREDEHAVAAAIILQNWLDDQPKKV